MGSCGVALPSSDFNPLSSRRRVHSPSAEDDRIGAKTAGSIECIIRTTE